MMGSGERACLLVDGRQLWSQPSWSRVEAWVFKETITVTREGIWGWSRWNIPPPKFIHLLTVAIRRTASIQASWLSLSLSRFGVWFAHIYVHECIWSSEQPMKFTFPDETMRLREVVICLTWPQAWVRNGDLKSIIFWAQQCIMPSWWQTPLTLLRAWVAYDPSKHCWEKLPSMSDLTLCP